MTESTIRVVLVDDDAMVRSALRMFLGGDQGIAIVGEAGDGAHALAVVREHRPDVVLMDIRMPLVDGLAATEAIMGWPQPPRIIVLTTFDTDEDVLHALRSGAAGFLLKDTPPGQLVQAIRTVARGEPMLSPSVTAQLIAAVSASPVGVGSPVADKARAALEQLSDRELEVAQAVARGLSNAEISGELYLSVATVKTHIGRILSKLGLDNRVQIALAVRDADLPS
ncbi:MAG: response regulator transcription factor [Phycicoccus sp.]|nr:response regulator transcription factor [Phycicoccus sp.]